MPPMPLKDYIEAAKAPANRPKPVPHGSAIQRRSGPGKDKRDPEGRFLPGVGGGPGRPPGFAALIREMTADGEELVMHALEVMRGERFMVVTQHTQHGEPYEVELAPTFAEQQAARNWLADRGFGKSVERIEVAQALAAPEIDYGRLTLEQRIELERLMVLASPLLPASQRTVEATEVLNGETN